jgi:hypothetical protein
MLLTSVRKIKALNVKIRHPKNSEAGERDRFIKVHRIKHVLCINCMKLILIYFLVLGGHLAFG